VQGCPHPLLPAHPPSPSLFSQPARSTPSPSSRHARSTPSLSSHHTSAPSGCTPAAAGGDATGPCSGVAAAPGSAAEGDAAVSPMPAAASGDAAASACCPAPAPPACAYYTPRGWKRGWRRSLLWQPSPAAQPLLLRPAPIAHQGWKGSGVGSQLSSPPLQVPADAHLCGGAVCGSLLLLPSPCSSGLHRWHT
jgi:hypothetical protein